MIVSALAGAIALTILAQSAPPPFVANDKEGKAGLLHVGRITIPCGGAPCPQRAVFDPRARSADGVIYADRDGKAPPPPMTGNKNVQDEVTRAWKDHRCIAVEARLIPGESDRPVLRVDRVTGPCPEAGH